MHSPSCQPERYDQEAFMTRSIFHRHFQLGLVRLTELLLFMLFCCFARCLSLSLDLSVTLLTLNTYTTPLKHVHNVEMHKHKQTHTDTHTHTRTHTHTHTHTTQFLKTSSCLIAEPFVNQSCLVRGPSTLSRSGQSQQFFSVLELG